MYPYPIYRLPDYHTTYIEGTFPQHHWPFEHARHSVRHAMHDVFNPYLGDRALSPRTDIRETIEKFYIDVELPGLSSKEDLTLTWTNTSTLLLEANMHRSEIHPNEEEIGKDTPKENPIHLLCKERQVGKVARSFAFFVEVNAETMTANIMHGILHITLEKMPHEQVKPKTVEVEHS